MSFFRTYIDPKIQEELFNREKSINFNYDSPQNTLSPINDSIQHQFVKACWARASVVLGNESNNKVVSLNSLLDEDNNIINEPLNVKNGNPYRGKPGITNISSNYKEFFLKQSTLSFYVPDPDDFDLFKNQFLKFGRYMLIEFGWSLPYNLSLPALSGNTVLDISKDLNKRIKKGNGNYNAMVGVVTNYNYNLTNEGAYEGTIEVSSMGRNVLGSSTKGDSKVDNIVGYVNEKIQKIEKENVELKEGEVDIYKTLRNTFVSFNATISSLKDVVEKYLEADENLDSFTLQKAKPKYNRDGIQLPSDDVDDVVVAYRYKNGAAVIESANVVEANDKPCYVSWGWFKDHILNSFFSFNSQDSDNVDFKTSIRSVRKSVKEFELMGDFAVDTEDNEETLVNNYCKTNDNLFSLGFKSIILPGNIKEFKNEKNLKYERLYRSQLFLKLTELINRDFPRFETANNQGDTVGQIRNMVFEVDYLVDSFSNITSLDKALNDFWRKVSDDYGGFWRFAVVEDENVDGRIMITDLNIGEVDDRRALGQLSTDDNFKIYPFKVYSNNSIVQNIELSSENSSEMATLAVYGSNIDLDSTSADEGKGYTALSMRALSMIENVNHNSETPENSENKNYLDAILQNISSPVFGNFVNSKKSEGTTSTIDPISGQPGKLERSGGIRFDDVDEILQTQTKIHTDLGKLVEYDTAPAAIRQAFYWFEDMDTDVQIYDTRTMEMYEEFKRTMLFLINKAPSEVGLNGSSNYSAVLPVVPLQLTITLQGIGGIKIGDLFHIDYLPKTFRKYCHFMVVNVSHEISPVGWTTTLESRMIVDVPSMIEDGQVVQGKSFQPIIVKNTLDKKVAEITKEYEEVNKEIQEDNKAREKELQKELARQRAQDISDRLAETETPSAVSRFLDNFGYGN